VTLPSVSIPVWLQILVAFTVPLPFSSGVSAGIVLARDHAVPPAATVALYVLSDVLSAFYLEPIARILRRWLERSPIGVLILEFLARLAYRTRVISGRLGLPLGLFAFCFATDLLTSALVSIGFPISRVLVWICIIPADVIWFLIVLLASLGIATFLADSRLLFVAIIVLSIVLPLLMFRVLGKLRAPASSPR
jgi:hypothetical protein